MAKTKRKREARKNPILHRLQCIANQSRVRGHSPCFTPWWVVKAKYPTDHCCTSCGKKARLVIDHNHDTGIFRGWICYKCNSLRGLKDNVSAK